MKKVVRIACITLIFIIGLAVLMWLFLQTPVSNKILKNLLVSQSSRFIQGELNIESIEGNLLREFSLNMIELKLEGYDFFRADSIRLKYSLRELLRMRLKLEYFRLTGPEITLYSLPGDKGYNFSRLKKDTAPEENEVDKESSVLPFSLIIDELTIKEAEVTVWTDESLTVFRQRFSELELAAGMNFSEDILEFRLDNLSFIYNDEIELKKLSFNLDYSPSGLNLGSLHLETQNSQVEGKLVAEEEFRSISLNLAAEKISLSEVDLLYPANHIGGPDPEFNLYLDYEEETVDFDFYIRRSEQEISLRGIISNLDPRDFQPDNFEYELRSELVRFKADDFFKSELVSDIMLNLEMSASGKGNLIDNNFKVEIKMKDSQFDDLIIDELFLTAIMIENKVNFILDTDNGPGRINIIAGLTDLKNPRDLHLELTLEEFDLSQSPFLEEQTDLNLRLLTELKSLDTEADTLFYTLEVYDSETGYIPVSSLTTEGKFFSDVLYIEKLILKNNDIKLNLHGYLSRDADSLIDLNFEIKEAHLISEFFDSPQLSFTALGRSRVKGVVDSFQAELSLDLQGLEYEQNTADKIFIDLMIQRTQEGFSGDSEINIDNLDLNGFTIKEIHLISNLQGNNLDSALSLDLSPGKAITGKFGINYAEKITCTFEDLQIRLNQIIWSNSEEFGVIYDYPKVTLDGFNLFRGDQAVLIDGYVVPGDSLDICLKLVNLDINEVNEFHELPLPVGGLVSLELDVSSTFSEPVVSSNIYWTDFQLKDIQLQSLDSEIVYDRELLSGNVSACLVSSEKIDLEFDIPLKLSLDGQFELNEQEDFYVAMFTDDLSLKLFDSLFEGIEIHDGYMVLLVNIENNPGDPYISAILLIRDGDISIPELGTRYRELMADIRLDRDKLNINNLYLRSTEGDLLIKGFAVLDFPELNLQDFEIDVNMNRFTLINTRALNALANSAVKLSGSSENPFFDGDLTIVRSRININELLENDVQRLDKPLLIQIEDPFHEVEPAERELERDFFDVDKLRGRLHVQIPRNTWVRGQEMNIELTGDIQVQKNAEYFEIFGEVGILRGFYEFYGKRFTFRNGSIYFSGGKDLNPAFDIHAVYFFRGPDRVRNELSLLVTGDLQMPVISFELNGNSISEPDAVSYIIFGRRFDELTQGERSEVSSQSALVGGILVNRLSEEVTNYVASRFQLDLFEFTGDASNAQVGIELGRYFTDRLFMSYRKDFNLKQSNEPVQEELRIEYELLRSLFLQATKSNNKDSGIDFIWKFER